MNDTGLTSAPYRQPQDGFLKTEPRAARPKGSVGGAFRNSRFNRACAARAAKYALLLRGRLLRGCSGVAPTKQRVWFSCAQFVGGAAALRGPVWEGL